MATRANCCLESWAANTCGRRDQTDLRKFADAARKEELQRLWWAWDREAGREGLTRFLTGCSGEPRREVFLAVSVFFRISPTRRAGGRIVVPLQLSDLLPADDVAACTQNGRLVTVHAIRQGFFFEFGPSAAVWPITSFRRAPRRQAPDSGGWQGRLYACPPLEVIQ